MTDLPQEAPLTETIPAPEILADGYASSTVVNGIVKFTFFSMAHDPASGMHHRRVVLRLALPLPVLMGVHQALGNLLEQMEQMAQTETAEPSHAHH